ncbi:MAG: hypothetical protein KME35_04790 [Aphanocapsa sp. GSE-SYN-MK-11-07L]|nr:hypothetical protein [Aphanocapsa sp. GSE-SYN-MK-11-07L]
MSESNKFSKSSLAVITNPKDAIEQAYENVRLQPNKPSWQGRSQVLPPPQSLPVVRTENRERVLRQQHLIESLTNELRRTQHQIGDLEQQLQESRHNSDRQSQQVQTLESVCQDLRGCLQRQRQQTLEFKAAVEKGMGLAHASHGQGSQEICIPRPNDPTEFPPPSSLTRPTAPIRPWSTSTVSPTGRPAHLSHPDHSSRIVPEASARKLKRSPTQIDLPSFTRRHSS